MQSEVEVVEGNIELHAHFFAYGFRANHVHAERRMKQCAELSARKIVRGVGQGHLQAGTGRTEGNDIVAVDRRRAERSRFDVVELIA